REEEQELTAEVTAARASLAALVAERETAEEAEREAERALAAVHRGVADRREGLARLTGQVAARRSAAEAAQAEIGRLRANLAEAEQRREQAQAEFRSEEHTSELQSRFDIVCRL